jgi:hypothetical protein
VLTGKVIKFSDEIRKRVDDRTRSVMAVCEEGLPYLWSALDQMPEHFVLATPGDDVRRYHNNYVKAILASTSAKQVSLTLGLIEAVNKYDFITYAMSARAIVEIIATLRHLLLNKLQPIIHEMATASQYDSSHVRRLMKEENNFLHGTRFDWVEFFEKGFRPLNDRYSEWLVEKKKDKSAKKWKPGREAPAAQVNVATCLEKWADAEPAVGVVYDLLCDMVHPNIGSFMSITVPSGEGLLYKVRDPGSEGMKLFQYSFPAFMSLTGHEYRRLLKGLLLLFLPLDEEEDGKLSQACTEHP